MPTSLLPSAASTEAAHTDTIFLILLGLSLAIIALVLIATIGFAIRFRQNSPAKRGDLPKAIASEFELAWTAVTLFVALFLFWWAAAADLSALVPPKNALEVHVLAKQWLWQAQHANGAREINALHAPLGVAVRLIMRSEDVIHSFFVPAFRMKADVVPGRATELWFKATKLGTFHLFCAEYCGTDHSRMIGSIVVMRPEDYARWLGAQPQGDGLARQGAALFTARGCSGCHAPSSPVHAPDLRGLYGRPVQLADGRAVIADEAYVRDAILMPQRDVAAGYAPIMPSYAGLLSEAEIESLTAYVRSLTAEPEGSR